MWITLSKEVLAECHHQAQNQKHAHLMDSKPHAHIMDSTPRSHSWDKMFTLAERGMQIVKDWACGDEELKLAMLWGSVKIRTQCSGIEARDHSNPLAKCRCLLYICLFVCLLV